MIVCFYRDEAQIQKDLIYFSEHISGKHLLMCNSLFINPWFLVNEKSLLFSNVNILNPQQIRDLFKVWN